KTPAPGPSDTNADATTTDSHVPTPGESASRVIPDDVTYTIIEENVVPEMKRSLDIRLNRKVSEDILRAIAIEVRGSDPKRYDRTFIGYYLPDMQVNAGCWATTHFTPDLEVRILGMTADQEVVLASEAVHASQEIIGRWLDERPFGRGRIV